MVPPGILPRCFQSSFKNSSGVRPGVPPEDPQDFFREILQSSAGNSSRVPAWIPSESLRAFSKEFVQRSSRICLGVSSGIPPKFLQDIEVSLGNSFGASPEISSDFHHSSSSNSTRNLSLSRNSFESLLSSTRNSSGVISRIILDFLREARAPPGIHSNLLKQLWWSSYKNAFALLLGFAQEFLFCQISSRNPSEFLQKGIWCSIGNPLKFSSIL